MASFKATSLSLLALATLGAASSNSSYCSTPDQTCKSFTVDLTWGKTPGDDIFSRDAILTNGTFPGPPLKLKQGDCVDFTVINNMEKVTGIHFHGLRQLATPWSDGVPGVSQPVIQAGKTWTYRWVADEPGVYFYHSHYKGQMMDGLYGSIVIDADEKEKRPFSQISSDQSAVDAMTKADANLEPIIVSDWNRATFDELWAYSQAANIDPSCVDSFILNGMGSQYCPDASVLAANSAPPAAKVLNGTSLTAKGCIPASNALVQGPQYNRTLSALPAGAYDQCTPFTGTNYTVTVDPKDGWAAMSFISAAGSALFNIAIDGHKLYVYSINGQDIAPQTVDQIPVTNGDRISFFVKLDQPAADYTIRVANAGLNQVISGFGVLSYKGSSGPASVAPSMTYGGANTTAIVPLVRAAAAPFAGIGPGVAADSDKTFLLDIMKTPPPSQQAWSWVLSGNQTYAESLDDQKPLLYQDPSTIPDSPLVLKTNYGEWIDLIIIINGPLAQPHPIHKHANKFYVLGAGVGSFNYSTVAEAAANGYPINLINPPYVDGYTSIPAEGNSSWLVLRYKVDTPGAWLLHCHVQTHMSGGMAVAILDGVDKFPTLPGDVGAQCASGDEAESGGKGGSKGSSSEGGSKGSDSGSGGSSATTSGGAAAATTEAYKGEAAVGGKVGAGFVAVVAVVVAMLF
jgi:FtsP/CotA-like multicopper oxidase with cupredoxin domain